MANAVLFDIDGTLIDSTYHHAIAWRRAFDRELLGVSMLAIHQAVGMGGDKLVRHLCGQQVEEQRGDALRRAWREEYAALRVEVTPFSGAVELVRRLRAQDYRVALASSGDPEFSREAVGMLDIGADIDLLTTSEDAEESKPDPDLVAVTCARLPGLDRAVFVGDTPYDVEAAAGAGLQCVAVRTGAFGVDELTEAGAVLVVNTPKDLLEVEWDAYLAEPARRTG